MIRDALTRLVDFLMSKPTEAPAPATVPTKPASKAGAPRKRRRMKAKRSAYAGPVRLDTGAPILDQLRQKR